MKKYLNMAMIYAVAALAGGVFYREFTKWNGFSGATMLGKVHTHFFMLGTFVFLIVALFAKSYNLSAQKTFRRFLYIYNIGVPLTVVMMLVRGTLQVLNVPLSTGMDAAISGMAGCGHILVGVGMILLLTALKKSDNYGRES